MDQIAETGFMAWMYGSAETIFAFGILGLICCAWKGLCIAMGWDE